MSQDTGLQPLSNSVLYLLKNFLERRTLVGLDKIKIKELGPDQPDIQITQQAKEKGKIYTRSFSRNWYNKQAWLAGWSHVHALFCFPCLLFKTVGTDTAWTATGIKDMKRILEKN